MLSMPRKAIGVECVSAGSGSGKVTAWADGRISIRAMVPVGMGDGRRSVVKCAVVAATSRRSAAVHFRSVSLSHASGGLGGDSGDGVGGGETFGACQSFRHHVGAVCSDGFGSMVDEFGRVGGGGAAGGSFGDAVVSGVVGVT